MSGIIPQTKLILKELFWTFCQFWASLWKSFSPINLDFSAPSEWTLINIFLARPAAVFGQIKEAGILGLLILPASSTFEFSNDWKFETSLKLWFRPKLSQTQFRWVKLKFLIQKCTELAPPCVNMKITQLSYSTFYKFLIRFYANSSIFNEWSLKRHKSSVKKAF